MTYIVIGNIIAFLASILMVYTGFIKKKKKIIYVQTIQCGLFVMSNLILGGITGAIINVIGCIRNILCYKNKLGLSSKIILTIISILFSLQYSFLLYPYISKYNSENEYGAHMVDTRANLADGQIII